MNSVLAKEDLKRKILKRLVYSVGKDPEFAVPRRTASRVRNTRSR